MVSAFGSQFSVRGSTVEMGANNIDIGTPSYLHVLKNRHVVRLFCDRNGMNTMIDFQLRTARNVMEFIRQMKDESDVFLMPVNHVKKELQDQGNGMFLGGADFYFNSAADAENFNDYVAPLFFPGFKPYWQGKTVVKLFTEALRTERGMHALLDREFEDFNRVTGNTLEAKLKDQAPNGLVKLPPLMTQGVHLEVSFDGVRELGNKVFKPNINDFLGRNDWAGLIQCLHAYPESYHDISPSNLPTVLSTVRMSTAPHAGHAYSILLDNLPLNFFDDEDGIGLNSLRLAENLSYLDLYALIQIPGMITKQQTLERIVLFLNSKFGPIVTNQELQALRATLLEDGTRVPAKLNQMIGGEPLQPSKCCSLQ